MLKARRSDRPPVPKKTINKKNNTIKKFYNSNFRFIKKYSVYIFLSLMILFVCFTVLAPMLVNLKVWKPEIKSMLESETGKIADIQGDIELSIYPSPQIKIYGISLKDEKDGVLKNFFNSDSMVAKISLWPLFKGNIVIDKIIFEDFIINLENYPNKIPNWVFYKKENKLDLDNNEFNENYKKFNHVKYPNIKVNEYVIKKGNIIYNKYYKINLKDIIIRNNNKVDVVNGYINIDGINFSLNSSLIKRKDVNQSWKTSFSLINKDIKILTNSNIKFNNNYPDLEGSLEISSNNIDKLSNNYKFLNLLNNKFKLVSDLSLSFNNNNLLYSMYNLSINSGPLKLSGTVSGNNGINPKIDVILSSNSIDLDSLNKRKSFLRDSFFIDKEKNVKTKNSYWDSYSASMLLSIGTTKFLEYPIRDVVIDIKKEKKNYILNIGKGTFPGNTKISFIGNLKDNFSVFEGSSAIVSDNIRQFSKWLSIDISNISDSRLRKTNLNSNVVLRNGGASFIGISGKIDSSKVSGEVRLRYADTNTLYAKMKVDKINLSAYLEASHESKNTTKKQSLSIFTFEEVNFDINFNKLLISKNEYNNIFLLGKYKNNLLQIDKLNVLNFAKGDFSLIGNIDYSSKAKVYDLKINFSHKDFVQFYNFYNIPQYFQNLFIGKGKIEFIAKGELDSLVSNLKLDTDRLNFLYKGDFNFKNLSFVEYEGKINLKTNNLNNFLSSNSNNDIKDKANFFSDISMVNNKLNIKNISFESNTYKYKGDIDIDYLENNNIAFYADLHAKLISINDIENIYNYFNLSPNSLLKGRVKLKSDLFKINNFNIYNFNSLVNFDGEVSYLKKFEGDLFNGTISAELKRSNKKEYIYNGNIKFLNIDGNKLINNYFSYNKVQADIASNLKINGRASNVKQFFETLNAEGEIYFKNTTLEGLDVNKLKETRNIKNELSIEKLILESFNTDKKTKVNNFSIKYDVNNNNLILYETKLVIEDLSSLLKVKFNFYNNKYSGVLKIYVDEIDNKSIFLNFIQDNNIKDIFIKNNYSFNKDIPDNKTKLDTIDLINTPKKKTNTDNFEDIIDDLSNELDLSSFDNESVLEDKKSNINHSISSNTSKGENILIDSKEIVIPNLKIYKLPLYLKDIKSLIFVNYSKPKILKNIIIKPKLPTQEDLLNNLLESVLNP